MSEQMKQHDRLVVVLEELRERGQRADAEARVARPAPGAARQAQREPEERPRLLFFYSERSGACRRVEAYLAQIVQRRQNHDTFQVVRVCLERRPELFEKFGVEDVPTFVVLEGRRVRASVAKPQRRTQIEAVLQPWLR